MTLFVNNEPLEAPNGYFTLDMLLEKLGKKSYASVSTIEVNGLIVSPFEWHVWTLRDLDRVDIFELKTL